MNETVKRLMQSAGIEKYITSECQLRIEHISRLLIYDVLSELTNDSSLGESRVDTIKRLALKYGVNINEDRGSDKKTKDVL